MISVVTNAVVALMIVSNTYQRVDGFEAYWQPDNPIYSCGNGLYVHKTQHPETLYRIVNTTNFVYQREYHAGKEAVKYFNDNFVTTNEIKKISPQIRYDDFGIPIQEPVPLPYIIHRREGGAK